MKQTIKSLSKHNKKDFDNLMAYYYSIQAYLHEPALHRFFIEESITSDPNIELPSHLAENVEKCSTSCFLALTHFAQLSKDDIAVMPLFYSSRIINKINNKNNNNSKNNNNIINNNSNNNIL
ncbi:unnamed protein product [[Candida] boidinii]|nr:unnamed protein product [[Candida] boidinii]